MNDNVVFEDCPRCGEGCQGEIVQNFLHDVRCWGWGTARYNAWFLIREKLGFLWR